MIAHFLSISLSLIYLKTMRNSPFWTDLMHKNMNFATVFYAKVIFYDKSVLCFIFKYFLNLQYLGIISCAQLKGFGNMQDVEQLIIENETLIKKVIYKLKIYRDLDEYMQVGRIALWQALLKFDDTKGDFAMFAYMNIKYAIIRALTKANEVSVHELAVEDDIITVNTPQYNLVTSSLEWPEWFEELNEDEQFLLIALYERELSLKEIADKYKLSYETIKKRRQRLLSKIRGLLI